MRSIVEDTEQITPDRDLYSTLLSANSAAFQAGHYETAYHALMAALHSADDIGDPDRLDQVAALAEKQQDTIDAAEPGHRLSSGAASKHGIQGVYHIAANQARTRAVLIRRHSP